MHTLKELRSQMTQKYPDDNNLIQPAIDHLNNENKLKRAIETNHPGLDLKFTKAFNLSFITTTPINLEPC